MRRLIYIIMFAHVLLLASCGQKHDAKNIVESFLEANLNDPSSLSNVSVTRLDSTSVVGDSIIDALRASAQASGNCKANATYAERQGKGKLLIARTTYLVGTRQYAGTFYIDTKAEGVVAFMASEKTE